MRTDFLSTRPYLAYSVKLIGPVAMVMQWAWEKEKEVDV